MSHNARKAVILLSGGLDSATALAIAKSQGFETYALSFDYKQRHVQELEQAKRVAARSGVKDHVIAAIDLSIFTGSALTGPLEVPKHRSENELTSSIPVTYVPARNTIFLSYALGYAESIGAYDIFIGVNAVDYSGYPDCRPEYIEAFQHLAQLATKNGVTGHTLCIHTPLISLTKAEIIKTGTALGVDYSLTMSCYDPIGDEACGACDACQLRLKGFEEALIQDPVAYALIDHTEVR